MLEFPQRLEAAADWEALSARVELVPFPFIHEPKFVLVARTINDQRPATNGWFRILSDDLSQR